MIYFTAIIYIIVNLYDQGVRISSSFFSDDFTWYSALSFFYIIFYSIKSDAYIRAYFNTSAYWYIVVCPLGSFNTRPVSFICYSN